MPSVEESASDSSVSLTSTELELTQATTNQKVGIRFANVNLPQGATLLSASKCRCKRLQSATSSSSSVLNWNIP